MKKLAWSLGVGAVVLGTVLSFERPQRLALELVDLIYFPYFASPSLAEVLPDDFEPPPVLETASFRLRPIQVSDYRRDYEAVMRSRGRIRGLGGEGDPWPEDNLSLADNYLQLLRHQKEAENRFSFTYTVESLDGKETLGCVYIVPARRTGFQAEVFYWVVSGPGERERDRELGSVLETWLKQRWPFQIAQVVYPGRSIAWKAYLDDSATIAGN